jgi:hypothetical protein
VKFNPDDLIDINQKKGLPRTYHFNLQLRWLSVFASLLTLGICLWFVFFQLTMQYPMFFRILPFLLIFFAVQTLFTQASSLNAVRFDPERIIFIYLLRKPHVIYWRQFRKMSFSTKGFRSIKITYEEGSELKEYQLTITFQNIIEIVNAIAELCPQLEFDDFMRNVIVRERAKSIERGEHADS